MKILIFLDAPPSGVNPITINIEDETVTARMFFDTLVASEGSVSDDVFIPMSKVASVVITERAKK